VDPDYHLKFALPPMLALVPAGRHQPCIAGCILTIEPVEHDLVVDVAGLSRELVFEQARRFLRIVGKGHGAVSIPATLVTPAPQHVIAAAPGRSRPSSTGFGGRDSWSIIVNAEVSFAATSIAPDLGLSERPSRRSRNIRQDGRERPGGSSRRA
jgi:hypothetical protein